MMSITSTAAGAGAADPAQPPPYDVLLQAYQCVRTGVAVLRPLPDGDALVEHANPAFVRQLGGSGGGVIGQRLLALLAGQQSGPARFAPRLAESVLRCAVGGRVAQFEVRLPPTGRARGSDLTVTLQPLPPDGAPRVLLLVRDLGERRQAEIASREGEAMLKATMETLPLAMLLSRRTDGTILYANPPLGELVGVPADQLVGRRTPDFYAHPEDRAALLAGLTRGQVVIGHELQMRRADGQLIWASVALRAGEVRGEAVVAASFLDITERRQMEIALRAATEAAQQGARAKAEFLATMSHEIRTPMNGVIGVAGLLRDTPLSDEQRDYVDTIRGSSEALLVILNDILDFSKIEAGKLELERIELDPRVALEDTLDLLAAQAHGKGLELHGYMDPAVPRRLIGDPGRLRQVLTNLVSNAVKFTSRGEVAVRVVPVAGGRLRFEVRDTGIGLSVEQQGRLFRPFSQVDSSMARRYGGTGLGLAICAHLVRLMGGEIGVDSQPSNGSTFYFTAELPELSAVPALRGPEAPTRLSGRVLLCGEEGGHRASLAARLNDLGLQVQQVDVFEGLAQVRAWAPKVVVLDQAPGWSRERARDVHAELQGGLQEGASLLRLLPYGQGGRGEAPGSWLAKPVRQQGLLRRLRQLLGSVAADEPAPAAAVATERPEELLPPAGRYRVLVAEDNVVNQRVVGKMLEKLGLAVDFAGNGIEAVSATRRVPYDVVLMDCQMPEMDGLAATRAIRAAERGGRLPIIALTANAMSGDQQACLLAGMDGYLSKPLTREALVRELRRHLGD